MLPEVMLPQIKPTKSDLPQGRTPGFLGPSHGVEGMSVRRKSPFFFWCRCTFFFGVSRVWKKKTLENAMEGNIHFFCYASNVYEKNTEFMPFCYATYIQGKSVRPIVPHSDVLGTPQTAEVK